MSKACATTFAQSKKKKTAGVPRDASRDAFELIQSRVSSRKLANLITFCWVFAIMFQFGCCPLGLAPCAAVNAEIRLLWLLCFQLYYFLGEAARRPNWIAVVCVPSAKTLNIPIIQLEGMQRAYPSFLSSKNRNTDG